MNNSIKSANFTGSNDNDSIFNSGDNVYIRFGKGKDTVENGGTKPYLNGGASNDTLTGGDDDLFIFSAGNYVITDFATGDKISLFHVNDDTYKISGSNITKQ